MKKILLVGGLGTIGQHLYEKYLLENNKVFIITNKKFSKSFNNNLKIYNLDITNKKIVFSFLNKFLFDKIFFLASTSLPSSQKEKFIFFKKNINSNILGLINFLEFAAAHKKTKLFYSSTSHIFNNQKKISQNENTRHDYNTYYGLVKSMATNLCEFYRANKGVYCQVGILYTNFSKYTNKNFVIKKIFNLLNSKSKNVYVNNVNAKIDILSTRDCVTAIDKLMNLKISSTYIISSNSLVTVKELFNIICRKKKIYKNIFSLRKNTKNIILKGNNKKIIKKINWRPRNIYDSIEDMF